MENPKRSFWLGWLSGLALALSLGIFMNVMPLAEARKPSQLDIIYKVTAQNYYQIQKALAYQKNNTELLLQIAQRSKVKVEKIAPHTNRLQQELFTLDLKLKELNQ